MVSMKLNFRRILLLSVILLEAILICTSTEGNQSSAGLQTLFTLPTKGEIAKQVKKRLTATFQQPTFGRQRRQTRLLPFEDFFFNNLSLEDDGLTPPQLPTSVRPDDIALPAPILIYRATMNSGLRR